MKKSDCFYFESMGDDSSGVYQRVGKDRWQLVVVINPDDAETWNHPWPKFATDEEIIRWRGNATYHRAQLKAAFILGKEEIRREDEVPKG